VFERSKTRGKGQEVRMGRGCRRGERLRITQAQQRCLFTKNHGVLNAEEPLSVYNLFSKVFTCVPMEFLLGEFKGGGK
jgi:hypothetical protein